MSTSLSEQTFLEQIRRGDDEAWRSFIAAYEGRLAAFARSRLGDGPMVDDVVQETFVGFLVSLPNYDSARGLETYLFSICA
ncbi:MAG: sigma factor [Pirellulales bacterium]